MLRVRAKLDDLPHPGTHFLTLSQPFELASRNRNMTEHQNRRRNCERIAIAASRCEKKIPGCNAADTATALQQLFTVKAFSRKLLLLLCQRHGDVSIMSRTSQSSHLRRLVSSTQATRPWLGPLHPRWNRYSRHQESMLYDPGVVQERISRWPMLRCFLKSLFQATSPHMALTIFVSVQELQYPADAAIMRTSQI